MVGNKDFDIDLRYGQEGEAWLKILADERTMEVKRDKQWMTTENIFIECVYKNQPSGLLVTKADYFAYILTNDEGINVAVYIFRTYYLKMALMQMLEKNIVRKVIGGDGNHSVGIVLSVYRLGDLTMRCNTLRKDPNAKTYVTKLHETLLPSTPEINNTESVAQ